MTGDTLPFDLTGPQGVALRDALTAHREAVLQDLTVTLAQRPELQMQLSPNDAARRLAGVFYGNLLATLTFGTFSTFRRDILWHLSLARRRNLPVTLDDERALFVIVADAIAAALPDHAETIRALLAQVAAMIATLREEATAHPSGDKET